MNLSLYYAVLERRDPIDPEVVMASESWKAGQAEQRINEAPAEPSKI